MTAPGASTGAALTSEEQVHHRRGNAANSTAAVPVPMPVLAAGPWPLALLRVRSSLFWWGFFLCEESDITDAERACGTR